MKKLLRILALLVLLVGMAVSASAASALVLDQADLLRPQEEKVLQQSLDQVNQKYQVRLAVVTVKNTGNVKPGEFANGVLDKIKDSRLKGNMVLLLSMKDRDWYISTDNGMRKMITDKAGITLFIWPMRIRRTRNPMPRDTAAAMARARGLKALAGS